MIENALSAIEGAAADVFEEIAVGSWPLSSEDRMTLGYFIALQATRIPSQRNMVNHLAAQLLRLQVGAGGKAGLRKRLLESGREVSEDLVDQLWMQATRPEGPPMKRPKVEHIQQMLELTDELLKYVVGRPWTLVQFGRRSLITSDSPVALVDHPDSEPSQGVGFTTAWGITFPISRQRGLLMGSIQPLLDRRNSVEEVHRGRFDATEDGTTKFEKFFNYHTVANASEWLFHHPDDEGSVPAELPDPRPFNVEMDGVPTQFTGEPWFKGGDR